MRVPWKARPKGQQSGKTKRKQPKQSEILAYTRGETLEKKKKLRVREPRILGMCGVSVYLVPIPGTTKSMTVPMAL